MFIRFSCASHKSRNQVTQQYADAKEHELARIIENPR